MIYDKINDPNLSLNERIEKAKQLSAEQKEKRKEQEKKNNEDDGTNETDPGRPDKDQPEHTTKQKDEEER